MNQAKRYQNADSVDMFKVIEALNAAQADILAIHNMPYVQADEVAGHELVTASVVQLPDVNGEMVSRNIEHVMCHITANLRLAMAHVESERLRRFGWPTPAEEPWIMGVREKP